MQERVKQLEDEVRILRQELQRLSALIQTQVNAALIRRAVTDATISANGSGLATIDIDGAGTDGTQVTVYLDHAHGGEQVSSGKEIFIAWIVDRWVIFGAECE